MGEVGGDGGVTVLRGNEGHSLFPHRELIGIIHKRIPLLDQPLRKLLNLFKVITGMHHPVPLDAQHLQITLERAFKLIVLLFRVGIVEPEQHLAVVLVREGTVEDTGFDVTDVEVSRGFGRESEDDLAWDSVGEGSFDGAGLVLFRFGCLVLRGNQWTLLEETGGDLRYCSWR